MPAWPPLTGLNTSHGSFLASEWPQKEIPASPQRNLSMGPYQPPWRDAVHTRSTSPQLRAELPRGGPTAADQSAVLRGSHQTAAVFTSGGYIYVRRGAIGSAFSA